MIRSQPETSGADVLGGPGETRTLTGTDLNRVPLPIGLRAPSTALKSYRATRSAFLGVAGAAAGGGVL